ncbi:MAG: DUF134 domain-containing protein [Methanospirillum sp.]
MEAAEDTGEDRACCRTRGRPRVPRQIASDLPLRCFAPQCKPTKTAERVALLPGELESLRLVDLEGLQQEEAAAVLGISRKTLWRDLHEARRKVADALVHGKMIAMADCPCPRAGTCPRRAQEPCPQAADCPYLPLSNR